MSREKGVIIEEINMNEDTPDDLCLDMLSRAYYGERGYGRNILGPRKNVEGFTRDDIKGYMQRRYCSDNIVISMAGNIDINIAEAMVEKYFAGIQKCCCSKTDVKVELQAKSLYKTKDIEQVHIGIAFPSVKRYDKLFDATQIMNAILGGSMSSRLFQTVREELGLAYTVYSYISTYCETGTLAVYAGVNAEKYKQSAEAIYSCVNDLRKKNISEEEFLRGKEQLISSQIFAQESTSSQMLLFGKELLYRGRVYNFEDRVNKISSVTLKDVLDAIDVNFDDKFKAVSLVGAVDKPLA